MQRIDSRSRIAAEFTLRWKSSKAEHTEVLWGDPVSFWRDVLQAELAHVLVGKTVGDNAGVEITSDQFYAPYRDDKIVTVAPRQFQGADNFGNPIVPTPGRFYPQGMLIGVGGVYRQSVAPCRFLGIDDGRWFFNLNHPLAGYDLGFSMEVHSVQHVEKERGGRCENWFERITSDGPGMQAHYDGDGSWVLSSENFKRIDDTPDGIFYQKPRLVHHLDSTAREIIGEQYASLLPDKARVLDLMGSWNSHLPERFNLGRLTVLGMNEQELSSNLRATDTVVQDLNSTPRLTFADSSVDAVLCTASVEYLTNPLAVLAELKRVLRPGGVVIFSFSNRWFPPKAIVIWEQMHEFERLGWVGELICQAGGFDGLSTFSYRGRPRPVDDPHQELSFSDPVYMVWARKSEKE